MFFFTGVFGSLTSVGSAVAKSWWTLTFVFAHERLLVPGGIWMVMPLSHKQLSLWVKCCCGRTRHMPVSRELGCGGVPLIFTI